MVKKYFAVLLCAAMMISMSACGEEESNSSEISETVEQTQTVEETSAVDEGVSSENDSISAEVDTIGQILLQDFMTRSADESVDITTLANDILGNGVIQFSGATMPVEPGLLTGFGNAEITGFKEGVMFSPMIGSIAFVGYIFELEDGTDTDAFMNTLSENANPRWNVCTEADETVIDKSGNRVFFLMCPSQFEE